MEAGMFMQAAEPLKANTTTCIPRLRGGVRRPRRGGARPAGPASVSVIDRIRDVVLRLAMLSAVTSSPTKGASRLQQMTTTAASPAAPSRAASVRMSPSPAYSDSYRSEAVDDCIEFFKRSAAGGGATPTAAAAAATAELVSSPPSHLHASACAMGI